jgi:hypothetical protein
MGRLARSRFSRICSPSSGSLDWSRHRDPRVRFSPGAFLRYVLLVRLLHGFPTSIGRHLTKPSRDDHRHRCLAPDGVCHTTSRDSAPPSSFGGSHDDQIHPFYLCNLDNRVSRVPYHYERAAAFVGRVWEPDRKFAFAPGCSFSGHEPPRCRQIHRDQHTTHRSSVHQENRATRASL